MSMFRRHRQLRSWAALVLTLWVFGIWAGVANACLTSPALQPDHEATAMHALDGVSSEGGHAHLSGTSHDHAADTSDHSAVDDSHDGQSSKSNCTDFCDKASASLPSSKWAFDDLQVQALQSFAVVSVILTMPAHEPVQQWVPRRDGVRAPPIPIVFLRLTL